MSLNEEQLVEQLRTDRNFFERHAYLLTEIYLPSPHGSGTVSLAERQQLAQRDKIRVLEAKLAELIQFGEENDVISERVHRLSLGILSARHFEALLEIIADHLREDFQVPHVALRLWCKPQRAEDTQHEAFSPMDEALRNWTHSMTAPYCGQPIPGMDLWFPNLPIALQSAAVVALRGEQAFGLLALASEDSKRFYPEMGTLYLKRIGEMISVALLRFILLESTTTATD